MITELFDTAVEPALDCVDILLKDIRDLLEFSVLKVAQYDDRLVLLRQGIERPPEIDLITVVLRVGLPRKALYAPFCTISQASASLWT